MSESFNTASRLAGAGSDVDWEERYRQCDTPWEKGAAHPALVAWLRKNPVSVSGRVMVPGCGLGHDARALAEAGAEVVGLDIAPFAITAARGFPLRGDISFVLGDLFHPDAVRGEFDWIFEHTCFCAIPPGRRGDYVRSVRALLKPGGHLLAIFFLNPDHDEDGPPYGCSVEELDALFSPYFRLVEESGNLPTYPGREGREIMRLLRRI
jgi:SAM-dependent methyltransferase